MELLSKIQSPFNNLTFEEKKHKYYVKGTPIKTSVSGLITQFYEKFNAELVAPYSAAKEGVTTEKILAQWASINQESRDRGHRVHNFGELYQFDRSLKPSCLQEEAIVAFWKSIPEHIIPVAAELRMYHFKNYKGKTMTGPFSHLLDNPLNHYVIQLSYYQLLLEQVGVKVTKRVIVWLGLDGKFSMIDTDDVTDILKITLNS